MLGRSPSVHSIAAAVLCLSWAATPQTARADDALHVLSAKPGDVRVDGSLREWSPRPSGSLSVPGGASADFWLAADDDALYLAARIADATPVRTRRADRREDALVLRLGVPDAGGRFHERAVWLFAGVPGSIASSAQFLPAVRGAQAQVVEGPDGEALALEARIPWQYLGGKQTHVLRGALGLRDVTRRGGKARSADTARGKAGALPWLRLQGGAGDALRALRRERDLPPGPPKHDFVVARGDGALLRVVLHGRYLVVLGGDGHLRYRELPVMGAADIGDAGLRELTGKPGRELVVSLRQQNQLGERTVVHVFGFDDGEPQPLWAAETRKVTAAGEVEAELRFERGRRGGPTQIVVSVGHADGLSQDNYREHAAADAEPIPLPWGPVLQRRYAFVDGRITLQHEQENPDHAESTMVTIEKPATPVRRRPAPQAPPPPGNAALVDAFRDAQGIAPELRARFVRTVNLAGDRRRETLQVLGRHLLVVGDGYREGRGYFYFELPAQRAEDVLWLFTGDVTGDGRREVFVRIRRPVQQDVQREVLLGYTFEGEAMREIFRGEVRRARGADAIGNVVSLVPHRKHWALQIRPGTPRGWSQGHYPFAPEPQSDHAPLLLPWQDGVVRFRYDGQRLVR